MESWTSSGISVCGALRQCLGKSWSMFPCLDRSVIVWECHVWGFLALKPRDSNPGSWVPWFWGSTWIHFCWPKLAGEESAVAGSQCQQQGWKDCFADGFPSFSNQFSSSLPSSIKHFPIFPTRFSIQCFHHQPTIFLIFHPIFHPMVIINRPCPHIFHLLLIQFTIISQPFSIFSI